MSRQSSLPEHSPDPSSSVPPSTRHSSSRSGSIASLWSSAEIPFFLDARRRSSDAVRKGSGGTGTGSSRSSGSRGHPAAFEERRRSIRDVPEDPMSPRPSVDSTMSSAEGPRRGSSLSRRDPLALRDASSSSRGFQTRKPAALAIHPIPFSSPLATHNERDGSPTTTTTTTSTQAASPVPSNETEISASCTTPMTTRSSAGPSVDNAPKPLPSLYARAGQFFRADYSMVSPAMLPELEDPAGFAAATPIDIVPRSTTVVTGLSPVAEAAMGTRQGSMGPRSPRTQLLRPHTAAASTASFLEAPFSREQHRRALAQQRHQSLVPAPARQTHALPEASYLAQDEAAARQRTMSVPRLSTQHSTHAHPMTSRQSSWSGVARHDSDDEGSNAGRDNSARNSTSHSVNRQAPSSPRSFKSGILRRGSRPSSSRLATPTSTSTAPGTFRPKSSGKGASGMNGATAGASVGWSSYLSEGLTLYIDQGTKRDFAIKVPYLRYDPFGRPEDIAAAAVTAGTTPGTPRKARFRTLSGKEVDTDDEVGTLEFGYSPYTKDAESVVFSTRDSPPILRHLGIGDDTKADLLTKQAALSLELNGVHEVSGYERNGKIAWRFKYQVSGVGGEAGEGKAMLQPVSFDCSATLLDPARARKARLFKMVRKGVSGTLASSLVASSSGARGSHSGESASSTSPTAMRRDVRRPSEATTRSAYQMRIEEQRRHGSVGHVRAVDVFGAAARPVSPTDLIRATKPPGSAMTASEEIKRAYILRSLEMDEQQVRVPEQQRRSPERERDQQRRSPAAQDKRRLTPPDALTTPTQEHFSSPEATTVPLPPSARGLTPISPPSPSGKSNRSPGGSAWAEHFGSLKASSQRRLRHAISAKALPELPPASTLPLLRKKKSMGAATAVSTPSGSLRSKAPAPLNGAQNGSGHLLSELGFI